MSHPAASDEATISDAPSRTKRSAASLEISRRVMIRYTYQYNPCSVKTQAFSGKGFRLDGTEFSNTSKGDTL